MRRATARVVPAALATCSSWRGCASGPGGLNVAPKKERREFKKPLQMPSESELPQDPKVEAEFSSAKIERKMEELSKLPPEEFEKMQKQFNAAEENEGRVLEEDSLYQMDVSTQQRLQGPVKVFWKNVAVEKMAVDEGTFYRVTLDGRHVKAFESQNYLVVPDEELAHAIANEWSMQKVHVNKLLMPLTDLASGASHVAPQGIPQRVDYLMSFFRNDNTYYRSAAIAEQQDATLRPVIDWFERAHGVELPRIVGIGHPHLSNPTQNAVRDALLALNMNTYQAVALCVVAQFFASLVLPMALLNNVIDIPTALKINRAEEAHNIEQHGEITGYHDIREADVVAKVCASTVSYRLMQKYSLEQCVPPISLLQPAPKKK